MYNAVSNRVHGSLLPAVCPPGNGIGALFALQQWGSLLRVSNAVCNVDNRIGDAGASALGAAFAAGGLPLLTSLNLEC